MKFDRWFNSHWLVADKVDTNQNFVKSSSVGFLIQAFCKHYILNCELALGHYGNNNGGGGGPNHWIRSSMAVQTLPRSSWER